MAEKSISGVHHYIGVSTDTKTTAGVPFGSTWLERNTGKRFVLSDAETWVEVEHLGLSTDAPHDGAEDTTGRSRVSLLKGIKNYVRDLIAKFPAALGASGGIKVELQAGTAEAGKVDTELPAAAALADGAANPTTPTVGSVPLLHNGTTVDRQRGNTEGTLLASAQRTATTSTATQTNHNSRGVIVILNVTNVHGDAPSVTVNIEEYDVASATWFERLVSTALAALGARTIILYPGVTDVANTRLARPLGRTWRTTVTHADAKPITYSVGYHLVV